MEPFPIPVRRTIAFGLTVVAVVSCRSGGGRATGTTGEEQERVDAPLPAIRSHDPGEVEMSDEYSFTEEQKAWMTRVARESVTAAAQGRDYTPPEPPDD